MSQNHFIFHDTLRENLLLAKPDASDKDLIAALRSAQLGNFLNHLPKGLDTIMGFQGRDYSGGEKQRICIARLLVRQSPIMILDEPWTNLDIQARNILSEVINKCKQSATVLLLTHETTEVLAADRAYRIDASTGGFVDLN